MTGSRKTLILGCASTGAKFTPRNHAATGDRLLDSICTGATIRTAPGELLDEARQLYEMGCRYYHYHARNPLTQEQTTDNDIYQAVSRALQNRFPDLMLSFGASRNGSEVQENIRRFGEWERVSHCAIPLHLGGAHFVTIQAAIELQVICELEKQRRKLDLDYASSPAFLADLRDYQPSTALEKAELQTHSTSKGADYGVTSPMTQFQVYRNAIQARQKLGLFHEVEWVQHVRSYAMTRFAVEHPRLRLGGSGQLNVILLFGFSPRLPFPETYQQFRAVIESAKSLEYDIGEPGVRKRKVSITVGAAVMPQHAAQADSQVDVLRVGMEDTPYAVDDDGQVTLSDNCQLLRQALDELRANGAEAELDGERIFQRMGMERTLGEYLSLQRLHPLGEANFTLAREFVQ
ncbi:TPA: 3-keto-5-aminohexanoate cleavage protein [Pseudomonas aeruginosa]|nr:3-keto-5-aminohexanoate cleavage protein [Pseudomonas aeruginosa]